MIVAPATANTLAKLANGICDNLIAAVYLSARCPVFFAPAMDVDMWLHPSVQSNVDKLTTFQNHLIPVEHGELASGLIGNGRMAEPETIIEHLRTHFGRSHQWMGKRILITAGPTYEPIDPVRFIGNRSSGKMGIALATAARERGASVTVILGPTAQKVENLEVVRVNTATEMYRSTLAMAPESDIIILAAAVSDYRPVVVHDRKIKKNSERITIELTRNPDIAKELGDKKQAHQLIVGFALETNDELANAQQKLEKKNFDFIVLNSLKDKGAGFNHQTNKITILHKNGEVKSFKLKGKDEVAEDILNELDGLLNIGTVNTSEDKLGLDDTTY